MPPSFHATQGVMPPDFHVTRGVILPQVYLYLVPS